MRKISLLLLALVFLLGVFGCSTISRKLRKDTSSQKSNGGFVSQIAKMFSPGEADSDSLVVVGFKVLEDKRPKQEISYLTSIKEKVSEKILNTIQDAQLFDQINYPTLDSDNIIISGEIRKFGWESTDTMISYIPGLNILPFLGLTSNRVHTDVEVYIEFKNKAANAVILGFVESYKKDRNYNIYNFQTDKAEEDLASCFKVVLNRIKERISANRNTILDTLRLGTPESNKPVERQQPTLTESAPSTEIQKVSTVVTPAADTVKAEAQAPVSTPTQTSKPAPAQAPEQVQTNTSQ
jgi:hypothetical protein